MIIVMHRLDGIWFRFKTLPPFISTLHLARAYSAGPKRIYISEQRAECDDLITKKTQATLTEWPHASPTYIHIAENNNKSIYIVEENI